MPPPKFTHHPCRASPQPRPAGRRPPAHPELRLEPGPNGMLYPRRKGESGTTSGRDPFRAARDRFDVPASTTRLARRLAPPSRADAPSTSAASSATVIAAATASSAPMSVASVSFLSACSAASSHPAARRAARMDAWLRRRIEHARPGGADDSGETAAAAASAGETGPGDGVERLGYMWDEWIVVWLGGVVEGGDEAEVEKAADWTAGRDADSGWVADVPGSAAEAEPWGLCVRGRWEEEDGELSKEMEEARRRRVRDALRRDEETEKDMRRAARRRATMQGREREAEEEADLAVAEWASWANRLMHQERGRCEAHAARAKKAAAGGGRLESAVGGDLDGSWHWGVDEESWTFKDWGNETRQGGIWKGQMNGSHLVNGGKGSDGMESLFGI